MVYLIEPLLCSLSITPIWVAWAPGISCPAFETEFLATARLWHIAKVIESLQNRRRHHSAEYPETSETSETAWPASLLHSHSHELPSHQGIENV